MADEVAKRDDQGQFLPGQSGNKAGRPKGKKNEITELKQDLEIAIRKSVPATRIQAIVLKMCELAEEGSVGAAKLILDKTLSNAKDADDVKQAEGGFTFVVKNITLQAETAPKGEVIDVTPEEVQ